MPGALVLLDGVGIPGTESICHHGVAWYAHTLGATVLGRLSRHPAVDLVEALADSIEHVAGLHRHSCDLADPSSPQATVAVVRYGELGLDHLVLAHAFVVLDRHDLVPQVVTDPREVGVRARRTSGRCRASSSRCGRGATSRAGTGSPRTTRPRPPRPSWAPPT